MAKYNILDNAFQEKKQRLGMSQINDENRSLVCEKLINFTKIKILSQELDRTPTINDMHYFFIRYNRIIPKSIRMTFNKPSKISEVRQIGAHLDRYSKFKIYYKITCQELKKLLKQLKDLDILRKKLIDNTYIKNFKNDKILQLFLQIEDVINIGFDEITITENIQNIAVKLLPIPEIIQFLREEDKFIEIDDDTYIAVIHTKHLNNINKRFPGFIYSSFEEIETLNLPKNLSSWKKELFEIKLEDKKINECIIGVIDSGMNLPKEFSKFIISSQDFRENKKTKKSVEHGSMVSSLIIANDELNPKAKDNLGNFSIKHFEVLNESISFFHFSKILKKIISENTDVKVWNISLGLLKKPYTRSISSTAMLLDKLSKENNIIFVVSSGNNGDITSKNYSLNTPGDSVNAITVGSVVWSQGKYNRSNYSSFGPILHFEKPEISHFGGPNNIDGSPLAVHDSTHIIYGQKGTSFSAPRVSRWIAYFISIGYTALQAKAKIITMTNRETESVKSSAFGWISNNESGIDLTASVFLKSKKPKFLPLEMPTQYESIKIASSYTANPKSNLGEEYLHNNVEISLVWAEPNILEFERSGKLITVQEKSGNKFLNFLTEKNLRLDNGKYFTSKLKSYSYESIKKWKEEGIKENKISYRAKLFVRIRKLSLFDLEDNLEVGFVIAIKGDFAEEEFVTKNESILEIKEEISISI